MGFFSFLKKKKKNDVPPAPKPIKMGDQGKKDDSSVHFPGYDSGSNYPDKSKPQQEQQQASQQGPQQPPSQPDTQQGTSDAGQQPPKPPSQSQQQAQSSQQIGQQDFQQSPAQTGGPQSQGFQAPPTPGGPQMGQQPPGQTGGQQSQDFQAPPDQDFSIPPLDLNDMDFGDEEKQEGGSSFAEKFGTKPGQEEKPEAQASQKQQSRDSQEEASSGKKSDDEKSVHDHLEDLGKTSQSSKEGTSDNPLKGGEEKPEQKKGEQESKEEIPAKPAGPKEEEPAPEQPKEDKATDKKDEIDFSKPFFLKVDDCSVIYERLHFIKNTIDTGDKNIPVFQKQETKSDKHYDSWRNTLETIQSNLLKMDKKLFR